MGLKKHIVFDLDGTIVDSHKIYQPMFQEFCTKMGLQCDLAKYITGYIDPVARDLGWGLPLAEQPAMNETLIAFHLEQMQQGRFVPPLFPGMENIIPELAEKYDLSIITANTRKVATIFVDCNGLASFFSAKRSLCCARERNYRIKPSADALYCLISETGHELHHSIMIGDSPVDIGLANDAGIKSIAALWGGYAVDKLQAENPTVMLENIAELPQTVEALFS
ncbi:MAG: putative haloacid dehydrogenase-like hydrolase [Alphaproteobacteria bacterium]|nr:putative haloacid dehydrogenase-like hydrolase [Alphaproteobacteria bacterium]